MLVRQSLIYGAGRIVTAGMGFVLIALYTRLLSPEEYGIYTFVMANAVYGFNIAVMWLCITTIRLLKKFDDHKKFMGAILSLYAGVLGLIVLGGAVAIFVVEEPVTKGLIALSLVLFATTSWMELNLRLLQARLQPVWYVAAYFLRSVVLGGVGGGLAWFGFGEYGAIAGAICGTLAPGIVMTVAMWRGVGFSTDPAMRQQILTFGLPLLGSFGLGTLINMTDRWMITLLAGPAAHGLYSAAHELAGRILNAISSPVANASMPVVVHTLETSGPQNARVELEKSVLLFLGTTMPCVVGLSVVAQDFMTVAVGGEFREAAILLLPYMAIGSFLGEFRRAYLEQAFHLGLKTRLHLAVTVCTIVVNLTLNFILIPRFGVMGAAVATLISEVLAAGLCIVLGRISFALPFPPFEIGKILAACAAMAAAVMVVPGDPGFMTLAVKVAAGGLVYVAFVLALDVGRMRAPLLQATRSMTDRLFARA